MSVVEAEKRMNRASIDSEIFELASRHHIARLFWNLIMAEKTEIEIFMSQPLFFLICWFNFQCFLLTKVSIGVFLFQCQ